MISRRWAYLLKQPEPRLLADTLILGVVGALSAQLFAWMLRVCQGFFLMWLAGYQPPGLRSCAMEIVSWL